MRFRAAVEMVGADFRRTLRGFSMASLGIAVGVATLSFFLALSSGMREVVLGRIFPLDLVEVIPPESSVGSVLTLFGARRSGIDDTQIAGLRRVEGVRTVLPRLRLAFPTMGRGGRSIMGRDVGAGEIPADGVEASMVAGDLRPGVRFDDPEPRSSRAPCHALGDCRPGEFCFFDSIPEWNRPPPPGHCSQPVPVVVSPYLVEVFNGAIAPAHNLPRLGELILRRAEGLVLEWDIGRAGLGAARQGTPRRIYAKLVGISPRAMDLGITIPIDVARRLNREYAGSDAAELYTSAVLYVRDPSRMTEVSAAVREQGLEVRTSGAEQMGLLVTAITAILALTSIVTVLVAALNIAHVFATLIAERRGELGLLRALGATRADVRNLVLLQASAIGAVSSVAGVALARAAAVACNHVARTRLPAFPFKPDDWFVFTAGTTVAVLAFGVGACVLSAVAPAVRAARAEPAEALAGGV